MIDPSERVRTIQTDYYLGRKKVKSTFSTWVTNCVPNATRHLQSNEYGANRVEVWNCVTGTLYAQMRAKLNGTAPPSIHTTFKRDAAKAFKEEQDE